MHAWLRSEMTQVRISSPTIKFQVSNIAEIVKSVHLFVLSSPPINRIIHHTLLEFSPSFNMYASRTTHCSTVGWLGFKGTFTVQRFVKGHCKRSMSFVDPVCLLHFTCLLYFDLWTNKWKWNERCHAFFTQIVYPINQHKWVKMSRYNN